MFEIEYKGANCVIISTKKTRLVTDPKLSIVGLSDIVTKDSVELATEERFAVNNPESTLVIDSPGEYGVGDLHISGFAAQRHIDTEKDSKQATIYRIEIGDARIGVLGNIFGKLSDDQLEQLGVVDVLILPVGGNGYTLDAKSAADLIHTIDPKIVIPVHYSDAKIKYEMPQGDLQSFIAELGAPVEVMAKYKVKQVPFAPDSLTVIELTRS
jgi:L-ascorbate metabolism protein UlaG (beta-lactamase superfamily)